MQPQATAVVLNLTATGAAGTGSLTVHPTGATRQKITNVHFLKGRNVSILVVAKVGGRRPDLDLQRQKLDSRRRRRRRLVQRGIELWSELIYEVDIWAQLRRSAVSVPGQTSRAGWLDSKRG